MNKKILIAFDFDGVVADTIYTLYDTYVTFADRYGIKVQYRDFEACNGLKLADVIKDIKQKYEIEEDFTDLYRIYNEILSQKMAFAKPMEGLREVIEELKENGYKMVITSSAEKNYIETFLQINELDFFEEIVSVEMVEYAKPYPDIYTYVKDAYNEYTVIAIEDSDNGLESAFNAGVKVLFFNKVNRKTQRPFHKEIADLKEILSTVKEFSDGYFISCRNIEIQLIDNPVCYSEEERKSIEEIWKKRPEGIFNGNVLALSAYRSIKDKLIIECFLVEYKYIYTFKKHNRDERKIVPLAVSGILLDKELNTIIAVRNKVTDYSGYYELLPSGGLDGKNITASICNYKEQILQELEEEIGIDDFRNKISDIVVLGICYDVKTCTMDICMQLCVEDTFSDALCVNTSEYKDKTLIVTKIDRIKEIFKGKNVVYTTKKICENIGDISNKYPYCVS